MNNSFNWLHNKHLRGENFTLQIFLSATFSIACNWRIAMRSGADAILRLQGRLPQPQIGLKSNFRALQKRRSEIGREKRGKTWRSMRRFWRPTRNSGGGLVVAGQLQVFTSEFAYHFHFTAYCYLHTLSHLHTWQIWWLNFNKDK
jgi:hypothetical protein